MAGAKLPSADSKHFNGFRAKFHGIAGGGLRAEASRRAARRRPPASSPHNFVPVFRLPLADCKDAMMTDALHGADAPFVRPDVWDAQRLASLLADVGEAGLRDILRLFLADVPFLQAQLARAIAAGDARAALQVIVPARTVERVVAVATTQDVGTGRAGDAVGQIRTDDAVVARAAYERIIAVAAFKSVIARVAKEMGILTVGVVTKPFDFEGGRRMQSAEAGLSELEANVDSLIVVLNEKLLEVLDEDVSQDEAFAHANDVLKNAVGGISESDVQLAISAGTPIIAFNVRANKQARDLAERGVKGRPARPALHAQTKEAAAALVPRVRVAPRLVDAPRQEAHHAVYVEVRVPVVARRGVAVPVADVDLHGEEADDLGPVHKRAGRLEQSVGALGLHAVERIT